MGQQGQVYTAMAERPNSLVQQAAAVYRHGTAVDKPARIQYTVEHVAVAVCDNRFATKAQQMGLEGVCRW